MTDPNKLSIPELEDLARNAFDQIFSFGELALGRKQEFLVALRGELEWALDGREMHLVELPESDH